MRVKVEAGEGEKVSTGEGVGVVEGDTLGEGVPEGDRVCVSLGVWEGEVGPVREGENWVEGLRVEEGDKDAREEAVELRG